MRYAIVYLIKGKAGKYNQRLIRGFGIKFKEYHIINSKIPPHITLKSPFKTKRIRNLESLIKEISRNHKKGKVEIKGFGDFHKHVAFLKTKISKEGRKIQKNLIKELEKEIKIKPHEFDIKWKPHATIVYANKDNFALIWNKLEKFRKPKFDLKLDNITILKKSGRYWKVYKEFKIK